MITDDDPTITYPRGWTLAVMLPHKLCDDLIADVIHDSAGNGKSHLQNIFDRAIHMDGPGVLNACYKVLYDVSEHPEAEKWFRENVWLEE